MKRCMLLISSLVAVVLLDTGCHKSTSPAAAPYIVQADLEKKLTVPYGKDGEQLVVYNQKMIFWETATMYVERLMLSAEWIGVNQSGSDGSGHKTTGQQLNLELPVHQKINLLQPMMVAAFRLDGGLYNNFRVSLLADRPQLPGVHIPAIVLTGRIGVYDNFVPVEINISEPILLQSAIKQGVYHDHPIAYAPELQIDLDQLTYGIEPNQLMHSTTIQGKIIISSSVNTQLYRLITNNLARAIVLR